MDLKQSNLKVDAESELKLAAIDKIMNPESIVIFGMSEREATAGRHILKNILVNGYSGAVHLIGRKPGSAEGIPIVTDLADLPRGIDLAIIMLPAPSVEDALRACIAHEVGASIVLASGFSEAG